LSEQVNLETLDGRAKLISLAMPFLQTIKAPIIKDLLISELGKITNTDSNKIENWSNVQTDNHPINQANQAPRPQPVAHNNGKRTPVRSAITLLLQFPKAAAHITSPLPRVNLPGIKLLTELLEITQSNPQISTGALLEHWRNKPEAKHLAKLASEKLLTPETGAATELEDIFKQIAISAIEQEIEQLLHKSKQTALTDEEKRKLQELFSQKAR
jgi:DNA primase